jgi:hypothetical protein
MEGGTEICEGKSTKNSVWVQANNEILHIVDMAEKVFKKKYYLATQFFYHHQRP